MLNTQIQLQYHTWEPLKVGRLERVGEEEHREGQKQFLQMQFSDNHAPKECGSEEGVWLKPSPYNMDCDRDRSSGLLNKQTPFSPPHHAKPW